jgi:hypothetical protein
MDGESAISICYDESTWTASNYPKTALNLGFFVDSMASAAWAKLFDGKLFSLTLFVFAGHVVAPFAAVALKSN